MGSAFVAMLSSPSKDTTSFSISRLLPSTTSVSFVATHSCKFAILRWACTHAEVAKYGGKVRTHETG
eukprot:3374184-Prorocentrum_lima.AAC.1